MSKQLICYRGSVEAWEIDHMGHMNVQFYLQKAMQALKIFFLRNNLQYDNYANYTENYSLRKSHLRYLKEQKAGSPLFVEAGMNFLDKSCFSITMVMKENFTHIPCAAFVLDYEINSKISKNIKNDLMLAFNKYPFPIPEYALPKGINPIKTDTLPLLQEAKKNNMRETYLGIVSKHFVDFNERMWPASYMAVISNAVPNILGQALSKAGNDNIGGAALEYSFRYQDFATIDTAITVRSGLEKLTKKTFTWRHWLFDQKNENLLADARALVITLDLKKRKSVEMPQKMYDSLNSIVIRNI